MDWDPTLLDSIINVESDEFNGQRCFQCQYLTLLLIVWAIINVSSNRISVTVEY